MISVQPGDCAVCDLPCRCGDQLLEFNGVSLRGMTAEQAACELAKHSDDVSLVAQYRYKKYSELQNTPGDSLYIRALFERSASDASELSFSPGDVLYVDNTMYSGSPGRWWAWKVREDGRKGEGGIIPSKYKRSSLDFHVILFHVILFHVILFHVILFQSGGPPREKISGRPRPRRQRKEGTECGAEVFLQEEEQNRREHAVRKNKAGGSTR
ncbi:unnamed protein product [Cyprideis torosa]|uniref:Uncharacterized protein n=1 Tax=Cyprideis torosa TaxID=163714 RepID=A0A7R9A0A2_9CRUS|nr:unnamed protein product [Cyprideis torosa]CAG0910626.1 unnamed protein product [Cyprideis torosa]